MEKKRSDIPTDDVAGLIDTHEGQQNSNFEFNVVNLRRFHIGRIHRYRYPDRYRKSIKTVMPLISIPIAMSTPKELLLRPPKA